MKYIAKREILTKKRDGSGYDKTYEDISIDIKLYRSKNEKYPFVMTVFESLESVVLNISYYSDHHLMRTSSEYKIFRKPLYECDQEEIQKIINRYDLVEITEDSLK